MSHASSTDYEQGFLGSLLISGGSLPPKLTIQPFCFSVPDNGRIFQTYLKQKNNGIAPDILTLSTDPDLASVDKSYIAELTSKVPSGANLQFYEKEIIKAWKIKTAKYANEQFAKKLESPEYAGEIEPLIQEHIRLLSGALYDSKKGNVLISFDDYIDSRVNKEYWKEFNPQLFKLPFPDGTISVIGAAPGSGKTAAMINLCRELLTTEPANNPHGRDIEKARDINAKRKMLFISAEMTTEDITDRLIRSLAWQKAGEGSPADLEKVTQTNTDYWKALKYAYNKAPDYWTFTGAEIERAKLYKGIIDKYIQPTWGDRLKIAYVRGVNTFDEICNIIVQNAEPGTLVLMDYLQLLPITAADVGQGNPRYLEIRHVMDMAVLTAEKSNSVIIAAAQLGREERKGENSRDDTQGWRESGDIEQHAWNAIKIIRQNDPPDLSYRVSKVRNSAGIGTTHQLEWVPAYQYMENLGEKKQEAKPAKDKRGNKSRALGERTPPDKQKTNEAGGLLG